MKKITVTSMLLYFTMAKAQVSIGTLTPDDSAVLELQSTSKGFLMPRVSLLSSSDIVTIPAPAKGLLVYNLSTTGNVTPGFYYWDGAWKPLATTVGSSTGTNWGLGGNTISSSDFLGSVNHNPLLFRVNNSLFGKFHPGGGLALGYGTNVNDNNSIAIGTNANASSGTLATAIGPSATASGYQSAAFGYGASAGNNSATALGYQAVASGQLSTAVGMNAAVSANGASAVGYGAQAGGYLSSAFGTNSNATGQSATAIGYQAIASQNNSIILGSSSNSSNRVGIGTNTPDERLHVVGSLKLVDGTQGNGYVLTSDANGKARWQNMSTQNYYGETYYSGSGQVLDQYNNISFGSNNSNSGVTINSDGITVMNTGVYRITYRVTIAKSSGAAINAGFNLYRNYNSLIPGSLAVINIGNNQTLTTSGSVITTLNAYDKVSVRSNVSDSAVTHQANGTVLSVELVQ